MVRPQSGNVMFCTADGFKFIDGPHDYSTGKIERPIIPKVDTIRNFGDPAYCFDPSKSEIVGTRLYVYFGYDEEKSVAIYHEVYEASEYRRLTECIEYYADENNYEYGRIQNDWYGENARRVLKGLPLKVDLDYEDTEQYAEYIKRQDAKTP